MERFPESPIQLPDNVEAAFDQQYQELSNVTARVFNKIIGLRDSNRAKTWDEVGDLGHIIEVMNELDEFLGV